MAYYPDEKTKKTREFLDRMVMHARNKNTRLHQKMKEYEADYFLETTGDTVRTTDNVYLSDLHDTVNVVRDILVNGKYRINFRRPGHSEVDKETAENLEQYIRNVIRAASLRNGYDIEDRLVEYQARLGLGVLHWAYDPSLLFQEDPLFIPPVDVWVIDPQNFYPVLDGPQGGFRYVFHIEMRSVEDAFQIAQTTAADSPEAMEQMLFYFRHMDEYERNSTQYELHNYWGWHNINGQWTVVNAIRFGDAILRPITPMPGYVTFPWSVAAARDTGHKEHDKKWLPITYGARGHVRRAERLQGLYDLLLEKFGMTPNVLEVTEEAPTPPNIVADPSYFITLYRGQRLIPPQIQGLPPDFWRQVDLAQDRIERSAFPRAMYGIGVESGYGFDKAQEGSKTKLNAPRRGLEQGVTAFVVGVMGLIANIFPRQPVHFTTLHLQQDRRLLELYGADLNPGSWDVSVRWSAAMPGDEARMTALASQASGGGLLSKETARERYLYVDDSKAEQEKIIREQAMSADPRIAEAYAYDVLQKMDAYPNPSAQQLLKVIAQVDEIRGQGQALGLSPEQIEQGVQAFIAGATQTQMQKFQAFSQGQNPNAPPGMPPSVQAQMEGGPPPGNPSDLGAELRQQANAMNGVTGERQ